MFKDLTSESGVFEIQIDDFNYIGFSSNIAKRVNAIYRALKNNAFTELLQSAYNNSHSKELKVTVLEKTKDSSKAKIHISSKKPNCNACFSVGFTKNHKQKLSNCKKGEKHNRAKLHIEDVVFIRNSSMTISALAKKFHISRTHVKRIQQNLSWNHL